MLRTPTRPLLALAVVVAASTSTPSIAQRSVAGVEDDEDDDDKDDKDDKEDPKDAGAKPAEDPKDPKKDPKKDAKKDPKKDEKPAEKPAEKADPKDVKSKKDDKKKATPEDVLADTEDDKKKRSAEDAARDKAEAAAAADDKKKAEEKARAAEQKKADAEKRRVETREQRLTAAKRNRELWRQEGDFGVVVAMEPGAVQKGALVEVRFDIARSLDVADPKFGGREPLKNLKLTATVSEGSGKKGSSRVYAVHSLGSPGNYGFHMTPSRDGVLQVQLIGDVGDRTLNVSFPLHVGTWPPPDFDDEDKKLVGKGS